MSFRNSAVSWPIHTNLNSDCKWFHPFSCIGIFTVTEMVRQVNWLKKIKFSFSSSFFSFELMYCRVIRMPEKRYEHVAWRKSRTLTARLHQLKLLWICSIWCGIRMVQKIIFLYQVTQWWSFKLQETKAMQEWVHNSLYVCIWFGSVAVAKILKLYGKHMVRRTLIQSLHLVSPTTCLSSWWIFCHYIQLKLVSTHVCFLSSFHHLNPCKEPDSHLKNFLLGRGRLLLHPSEAASSPGWTPLSPSVSSLQLGASSPKHPGGFPLDLHQLGLLMLFLP